MIDALTGETNIEEPVVSIKSGHIFEKRVIDKYLRDNNGKCPITDQDLTAQDLVSLKVNKVVKPRPPAATSIPGMLQLFQNEWDALMLESFTLKQQLDSVRQELAHSLYQHDAACRVIARLIKERDEARNALSNFQGASQTSAQSADSMEVDSGVIPEEVRATIDKKSAELTAGRKKRVKSEALATEEDIKSYKSTSNLTVHSASTPGILCVDVHPTKQDLVLTGGADHNIVLTNRSSKKIISTMKGHSKAIKEVLFHPTESKVFLSASADKTARVWVSKGDDVYEAEHVIKAHSGEVTGIAIQPTGEYFLTGSADSTWGLHEISSGRTILQVNAEQKIDFLKFHPDGLLFAAGSENCLKLWDMKTSKVAASFEGHAAHLVDVSFSENGYYFATAAKDDTIKLWDLRKRNRNETCVNTFQLPKNFSVSSLEFDYSGTYLAVAGSDIRIFTANKVLETFATLSEHTDIVTCVKWGRDCQWLASTSLDRNLKIWSK